MDKTSIHFRDNFFEEILNGIPDEDSRDEIIEIAEKGTKTNLSSDNKLRINNVVKAFLHDEESKALFINIIKNAKNREKNNWIKNFNLNFLISLKEDEEDKDDEDELAEEINDEEKSKGTFSSFKELKKKYDTIKTWREREKRIRRIVYFLKDSYVFLSNITFASMFGSKTKLIRGMNETMNELFHEFKPKYIDPLLYSGSYSLTSLTNILTKEIKNKVKIFYEFLEDVLQYIIEQEVGLIFRFVRPLRQAMEKIADIRDKITGNSLSPLKRLMRLKRVMKFVEIMMDEKKRNVFINSIRYGASAAIFKLSGELSDYDKRAINNYTQDVVKNIRNTGDNLAKSILNNKGISVSDVISSLDAGEGIGQLANMGKKYVDDQIRQFGDTLIGDLESKLSLHQKFDVAYNIVTSAYTERVEKSPWTKAISYLKYIVKASENLFYPFLDNLKSIIFENKSILNALGTPLNIEKYLKTIIDRGLVIDNGTGEKYRLINRHKKSQNNKRGGGKSNDPKIKISIQTSQSVVNTVNTKDGKVIEDSFGKKEFKPILNVIFDKDVKLGNNFKIRNYYHIRGIGKDEFIEENEIFNGEYSTSNFKLNKKWLEKINDSNMSTLGHFFHNLFHVYVFPDLPNAYRFKKNEKEEEYETYELPMLKLSKTETVTLKAGDKYTWFDVLLYEGRAESIMYNSMKKIVNNFTVACKSLKQFELKQF